VLATHGAGKFEFAHVLSSWQNISHPRANGNAVFLERFQRQGAKVQSERPKSLRLGVLAALR
jgi:hypothetical protein